MGKFFSACTLLKRTQCSISQVKTGKCASNVLVVLQYSRSVCAILLVPHSVASSVPSQGANTVQHRRDNPAGGLQPGIAQTPAAAPLGMGCSHTCYGSYVLLCLSYQDINKSAVILYKPSHLGTEFYVHNQFFSIS